MYLKWIEARRLSTSCFNTHVWSFSYISVKYIQKEESKIFSMCVSLFGQFLVKGKPLKGFECCM